MNKLLACCVLALAVSGCQTSSQKQDFADAIEKYQAASYHKVMFSYKKADGSAGYRYVSNWKYRPAVYLAGYLRCIRKLRTTKSPGPCTPLYLDDNDISTKSKAEISKILGTPPPSNNKKDTVGVYEKLRYGSLKYVGELLHVQYNRSPFIVTLDGGIKCTGEMDYKKGKFNTVTMPQGIWSLTCDNGRSLKGNYLWTAPDIGEAIGNDNKGHKINLVFKPTDS